jgi:hypothetical protein
MFTLLAWIYVGYNQLKFTFICDFPISQRPATEMIRAVNKFKSDFGGQIVALERVQPSSDHVPHRFVIHSSDIVLIA